MFTVIYVDDERDLLDLGKLFLERTPEFRVEIASSAKDALALLAIQPCDAIVSDYQMPEMDGIAFLKVIRERFGDVPFILFTGRGREEVVIEAINNGADFYLQKGGDVKAQFAELSHKIRQAMARRQAEHSLRESEKRLSDIFEFLPDATLAINRDGVIIAWNRAIEEMTGLSADQMLGKGDHEYSLPFYSERRPILIDLIFESDDIIEQKYSHIIRQKDVLIADTTLPHLKGKEVTLVGKASPLYNSQGDVVGAIEAIRDITEQKKSDDELQAAYEQITASEGELRHQLDLQAESESRAKESEEKYRDLFENSIVGIFRTTPEGKFSAINTTFARIAGYDSPQEMMEAIADIRTQLYVNLEDRDLFVNALKTDGFVKDFEAQYYHRDGHAVWILINAKVVFNLQGGVRYYEGTIEDITEQKKAKEALIREKIFSDAVLESIPGLLYLYDSDGRLVRWNNSHETVTGYTAEELAGMNILDWFRGDDEAIRIISEGVGRTLKDGQATAEANLLTKSGKRIPFFFTAKRLEIDGKTYFTGVGIDISDRQNTENALRESEATLASLFRAAPVGIGLVSNRVLLRANDRLCEMTGYSAGELIGKSARILYPDDEEFERVGRDKYEQIRKFGTGTIETRWQRKDGDIRDILLSSTPLDPENHATGVTFTALDITDRNRAAEALRESGEKYRNVIDFSPFGMHFYALHDDGSLVFTGSNPAADTILGVENSQFIGRTIEEAFPGLVDTEVPGKYRMVARNGDPWHTNQVIYDMGTIHGAFSVSAFQVRPGAMATAFFDITEQKKAEEELRSAIEKLTASEEKLMGQYEELAAAQEKLQKSQQQLEEIAGTVPGVVYQFYARHDGSMGVYYVSSRAGEVFGLDNATQDFFSWFTGQVDPRDREMFLQSVIEVVKAGQPWNFEGRFIKPSGEMIWFQGISRPIARQGELVYSGVLFDITNRKLAEEALHESEKKYRTLVETTGTGFVIIDEQGRVLDANPEYIRLSGHTSLGEIAGRSVTEWTAAYEKDKNVTAVRQCMRDGYIRNLEIDYVDASGTIVPIEINATVLPYGGAVRILTLCRDISKRRIMEEALRESEAKYRTVIEQSHDSIFIAQDGLLIFHNPSFATLTGYNSAELAGRAIADLIAPEDRELVLTRHQERQSGKVLPEVYEFSVLHHDGTSRIRVKMDITSATIGGRPATIGTLHNMMEERRREEALLESEARLSSILHGSPSLQFVIDRNHRIISWNKAIEDYSGIKAEDIVGTDQQWRAFYPEKRPVLADLLVDEKTDDIPKLYGGKFSVSRLVAGAYEATDFFPTMGASGKWLNVTAAPVRDAQGTIIGAVETLEDITERRNAEQALREANHKLNLLNSITRHDVANQLTILQGFAQIAAMKKGDPVIADYLTKIITAADTIAEHIEFTREYQEVGVRAPVWTLLEEVIARVEKRVPVKFSGTCKAIEVFTDPMLERVFFNIVDNAIRHGGRVTEITVRCEREPDGILVIVEDNGSGIPVAEKEKIFERGIGKNTGLGLFLVKEILSITGITIKETGIFGKGARFEIHVPEGTYRFVKP